MLGYGQTGLNRRRDAIFGWQVGRHEGVNRGQVRLPVSPWFLSAGGWPRPVSALCAASRPLAGEQLRSVGERLVASGTWPMHLSIHLNLALSLIYCTVRTFHARRNVTKYDLTSRHPHLAVLLPFIPRFPPSLLIFLPQLYFTFFHIFF